MQDDWLRRAELAVTKNEDDLAKEALKRRKSYQVGSRGIMSEVGSMIWRYMLEGAQGAINRNRRILGSL